MKKQKGEFLKQLTTIAFLSLAITAFLSLGITGCDSDDEIGGTFKGATVPMGSGNTHSWIKVSDDNKPVQIGITISEAALTNLPENHAGATFLLRLPSQKSLTPFNHVELNWNPHGHEPAHIYDKPHFDFHFYMITEAEQMAIPPYATATSKFDAFPGPEYMPPTYIPISGGIQAMGKHWVDVTSPELSQNNPQPFTQTFIYGSYDGKVNFLEPMVTLEFILATSTFSRDIPQPIKFAKEGYYPTKLHITKTTNGIEIILDTFVFRPKS
jgi:hypothetical protein